jgi:hypothetical protein
LGGESFLTLPYGKFYSVAFAERTEPLTLNSRVVHKNVLSAIPLDKAVPFLIAEPLDGSSFPLTHFLDSP